MPKSQFTELSIKEFSEWWRVCEEAPICTSPPLGQSSESTSCVRPIFQDFSALCCPRLQRHFLFQCPTLRMIPILARPKWEDFSLGFQNRQSLNNPCRTASEAVGEHQGENNQKFHGQFSFFLSFSSWGYFYELASTWSPGKTLFLVC